MNYYFRNYEVGDEATAKSLLRDGLAGYGLTVDYQNTDTDILDIDKSYCQQGGTFRFLVMDDQLVGMYGLFSMGDAVCELRKMYLRPDCKGKGLGKAMMDDALVRARDAGYSEMVLETNSVLKEAVSMYRKYGFSEYQPPHLSERCDFAMRKNL